MRTEENSLSIRLGPELHSLRPSLRCAYRLCLRHDGFESLARHLADGTLSVLADVIAEASGPNDGREAVAAALFDSLPAIDQITQTMLAFIFELCGLDDTPSAPDDSTKAAPRSKPEALPDFYARLFRIGTGWLGWTPEETWNATPGEIIAAYKGRTELLQAIFGGPSDDTTEADPESILSAELDREGLSALKGMGGI